MLFRSTDKTKEATIKFWFKDNWPELIVTFALDLMAMILLMDDDTNITGFLDSFLPDGLVVPVKLMIGSACGLGIGAGIYELFKSKLAAKKDQLIKTP